MDDYNPLERPVGNVSKPIQVQLGIVLQQLIDVVRYYIMLRKKLLMSIKADEFNYKIVSFDLLYLNY